jgi:hypothetical protein
MKFDVGVLHLMPLRNVSFLKIGAVKALLYLTGVNETLRVFPTFFVQFG